MIRITIEPFGPGHFQAVIWQRDQAAPAFYTVPVDTVEKAKLNAESALGLLDWGKGGQHPNQASVALDY
jgi:hypothetical protein